LETFEKSKEKWCHELKCATTTAKMRVTKVRAEPKTIGAADRRHIHYAIRRVLLEWQTQRFIQTASCVAVQ